MSERRREKYLEHICLGFFGTCLEFVTIWRERGGFYFKGTVECAYLLIYEFKLAFLGQNMLTID